MRYLLLLAGPALAAVVAVVGLWLRGDAFWIVTGAILAAALAGIEIIGAPPPRPARWWIRTLAVSAAMSTAFIILVRLAVLAGPG